MIAVLSLIIKKVTVALQELIKMDVKVKDVVGSLLDKDLQHHGVFSKVKIMSVIILILLALLNLLLKITTVPCINTLWKILISKEKEEY